MSTDRDEILAGVTASAQLASEPRSAVPCGGPGAPACLASDPRRSSGTTSPSPSSVVAISPESNVEQPDGWDYADALLGQAASLLADGAGDEVLGVQLLRRCNIEPTVSVGPDGPQWTCVLSDVPKLAGREFTLEYAAAGIVSLAAFDLDGPTAAGIVQQARTRWAPWCVEREFSVSDGRDHADFTRCALPGGPFLVLGRFPRDQAETSWQVSLAVMAAG